MKIINFKTIKNSRKLFLFYNTNISQTKILSNVVNENIISPLMNKNNNKYFFSYLKRDFGKKLKNKKIENENETEEKIEIDFGAIEKNFNNLINETKSELSKIKFGKINFEMIKNLEIKIKNKKESIDKYGQLILKGLTNCQINVYDESTITQLHKFLQGNLKDYQVTLDKSLINISLIGHNSREKKQEFLKEIKINIEDKKTHLRNIRANELKNIKKISSKIEKNLTLKIEKEIEKYYEKNKKELDNLYKIKEKETN